MDELFNGLNSRLRVCGLVADSIMIGIVNSAMEEAYEKVSSKKGDIERLKEKSRFCELAVMQLEWCLRFVKEEVDDCIVESSREREKLVSELTETRDQIQKRLEETELAIVRKDKEMGDRMENEWKLRQALKSKDEELSTLHVTLELERTKSDRVREFVHSNQLGGVDDRDDEFCELKNSLDQQFWNIKRRLEDGWVHSTDETPKFNGCCYNALELETVVSEPDFKLVEEGNYNMDDINYSLKSEQIGFYENDGGPHSEVLSCCVQTEVTERNLEFEQMGADIDILKEMLEVGFALMGNTISLSKVGLLERQWEWNVEREMVVLVLRGFLGDVEENSKTKYLHGQKDVTPSLTDEDWSSLMGDLKSLHHVVEQLLVMQTEVPCMLPMKHESGIPLCSSFQIDFGNKGTSQKHTYLKEESVDMSCSVDAPRKYPTNSLRRCGKCDTFLNFQELCHLADLPKENAAGHSDRHVAKMIKNHESIIKKKTEEISSQKGEILREKGPFSHRKDKDFDHVKKLIPEIISSLDIIIQEYAKSGVNLDDYEKKRPVFHKKLLESIFAEDEKVAVHTLTQASEKLGNAKVSHSVDMDSREEIRQLKQATEDFNIQKLISEEMHLSVFKGFLSQICLEVENYEMESLINEDVYMVSFKEMVREWNSDRESCHIESLIREEIYQIVHSEFMKDIKSSVNLILVNCHVARNQDTSLEDLPLANFLHSLETSKGSYLMQELDGMQTATEPMEDLMLVSTELLEMDKHVYLGDWKLEELDEESIQKDDDFDSVKSKLEMALEQIRVRKAQLKELGCSLGIAIGGWEEANHQMTLFKGIAQDMPNGKKQWNAFESVVIPLEDFSRAIINFECIIHEKQGVYIMRLDKAKHQLGQLIRYRPSIKAKELLYRKVFLRRCYNLQIAEAQVDLLGDKADELLCLLEKIYIALSRYSPVLQHYSGIMDILKLIRKELHGEAALTDMQ